MRTFYDVIDEVIVQLGVSTTVAFYTDQILNDWADKAHKWGAGYKKWPFTEARLSTTYVVDDTDTEVGFPYPEGWKPDSIRLLRVGGKRFKKVNFYKYQEFREDNSSSQEKIFSDYGNLYFINPKADVSGSTALWGQYTPKAWDYTDNTALTVFSYYAEEGNEALVEEVMSYAKKKEKKPQESSTHHQNAVRVLEELWQRIKDEQFGYHDTEGDGMFERLDIINGGLRDDTIKRDRWW